MKDYEIEPEKRDVYTLLNEQYGPLHQLMSDLEEAIKIHEEIYRQMERK
ncbi:MAG: hypothetical protein ACE5DM_02605 [Candidatus Nanoarchaeia archaeon]